MAFKKIPLTIDTMIRNPVPVEGINQEDNVELNIVVTENKTPKDLSSQTIKVYVRRIDGTLVEQTDQITPTNASKGEVTVKLKNSAFNKEGYALFQLDVSDSSGRITSSYATFKIGKGLVSGEAIANTNEIEALKKVEEYIKKANQELETFKQTVAEINENEATRQENEVVRVREEASRNEAEAIRAQQEATRKEKENERVQAEIKRIADEEMRRENEVLRGSKELERKQAEELRKETELLRIEDENNRKVAESKRIEVESVRVEAEKLRVAAETGRVGAESLRVTAEEERVAAETKREEGFNAFEGRISANTKELKAARSATTGEKFNTLDERIDHEVDRLNKKIDVTMFQQEDKESHTIENTIDGMTTDMCIKGRTLQNILSYENENDFIAPVGGTIRDSIITINADGTNKFILFKREKALVKPSTEYTLILDVLENSINVEGRINIDGANGCFTSSNGTIEIKSQKILMTSVNNVDEKKYSIDSVLKSNATSGVLKYRIAILEGNWINKEVPATYFKGIKSFGEQEGNKISILSHGKNLNKTNSIRFYKPENTERLKVINSSFFNVGKQYVFSCTNKKVKFYIENVDGTTLYTEHNKPFTINKNVARALLYCESTDYNANLLVEADDIQIEEGTQATIYEPYKQDKKDILLNQYGFENGLNGINDINDELNSIRNVAIKKINKYINSNNETINIHTIRNNTISFNYNFIRDTPKGKNSNPNIMINCFETNLSCYSNDIEGCFGTPSGFFGSVLKTKLESQDINGIAKYVRENFKECYYELAEPVETPFTENINLKTFGERTYISFENSISGTSSFKAPVNAAATISRLNRENRALEEENKNLRQDFESTTLKLTDSDLELVKQNVDVDFRLMEVEFALDIPQAILSSNINFKNKKGEVKSMARTPYEMMKIVILSGDYDREDYMHKVGKYYERGRMSKEEHDELMSLMTADEVIGG